MLFIICTKVLSNKGDIIIFETHNNIIDLAM